MTIDAEKYPQHAKVLSVNGQNQIVGCFLEWLQENGYTVCTFDSERWNGVGEYRPSRKSIEQMLAQYFEIDLVAFGAEKGKMVEELHDAVAARRAAEAGGSGGAGGDQARHGDGGKTAPVVLR